MTDDTNSGSDNANFGPKGQLKQTFNKDQDLQAKIALLPEEGREKIRFLGELRDSQMRRQLESQQRFRQQRVNEEQLALMEKDYIDPQPRPEGSGAQTVEFFRLEAERRVARREQYYRDRIEQTYNDGIREVVKSYEQNRDHDLDRER